MTEPREKLSRVFVFRKTKNKKQKTKNKKQKTKNTPSAQPYSSRHPQRSGD
jgi:hypothetical protein